MITPQNISFILIYLLRLRFLSYHVVYDVVKTYDSLYNKVLK